MSISEGLHEGEREEERGRRDGEKRVIQPESPPEIVFLLLSGFLLVYLTGLVLAAQAGAPRGVLFILPIGLLSLFLFLLAGGRLSRPSGPREFLISVFAPKAPKGGERRDESPVTRTDGGRFPRVQSCSVKCPHDRHLYEIRDDGGKLLANVLREKGADDPSLIGDLGQWLRNKVSEAMPEVGLEASLSKFIFTGSDSVPLGEMERKLVGGEYQAYDPERNMVAVIKFTGHSHLTPIFRVENGQGKVIAEFSDKSLESYREMIRPDGRVIAQITGDYSHFDAKYRIGSTAEYLISIEDRGFDPYHLLLCCRQRQYALLAFFHDGLYEFPRCRPQGGVQAMWDDLPEVESGMPGLRRPENIEDCIEQAWVVSDVIAMRWSRRVSS